MAFIDFFAPYLNAWSASLSTPGYTQNLVLAAVFFVLIMYLEILGGSYIKKVTAPALDDVILDRLPVVDVNFLFVETMGVLMTVFGLYQFAHPATVPYVLATLGLFTLIRRIFLIVTPLGAPKNILATYGFKPHRKLAHKIFQGHNDYFFSGHTGLPFLFFLLTPWPPLAITFLVGSIIMGIAVLLMHVHYTIDVLAAPFIVYSIFVLSQILFL